MKPGAPKPVSDPSIVQEFKSSGHVEEKPHPNHKHAPAPAAPLPGAGGSPRSLVEPPKHHGQAEADKPGAEDLDDEELESESEAADKPEGSKAGKGKHKKS